MKVLILGSGPSGLTASIYISRGAHEPIVIAGDAPGGQLMLTTEVENYPGFEQPILGPELIERMKKQAIRFGAQFVFRNASKVDFSSRPFKVWVDKDLYQGDAVIIATGASAKWIGLDNEQRLRGKGVSSCATCDGFFFRNKDVVVIGGGDSAIEEAIFLSKIANRVTVIHRRDELRAQKIIQQRAFKISNIEFLWSYVIVDILGKDKVEGIKIRNLKTGNIEDRKCEGVFVSIGYKPNTDIFVGHVGIDDKGYIIRKNHSMTSIEGVFVAGDVYDYEYRQAATAVGSGCEAALDTIRWLESQ